MVWLDLANAYGSVPHAMIEYFMDFFWIPERVKDYVMKYYEEFQMQFSTGKYTTRWVDLEVAIHMGCTISLILFVLVIEIITKAAERSGPGRAFSEGEELPPIRAFMDDLTLLCPSTEAVMNILTKTDVLFLQSCLFWLWMLSQRLLRDLVLEEHSAKGKSYHLYVLSWMT